MSTNHMTVMLFSEITHFIKSYDHACNNTNMASHWLETSLITICINPSVDSNQDGDRFWRRNLHLESILRLIFEMKNKVQNDAREKGNLEKD